MAFLADYVALSREIDGVRTLVRATVPTDSEGEDFLVEGNPGVVIGTVPEMTTVNSRRNRNGGIFSYSLRTMGSYNNRHSTNRSGQSFGFGINFGKRKHFCFDKRFYIGIYIGERFGFSFDKCLYKRIYFGLGFD